MYVPDIIGYSAAPDTESDIRKVYCAVKMTKNITRLKLNSQTFSDLTFKGWKHCKRLSERP